MRSFFRKFGGIVGYFLLFLIFSGFVYWVCTSLFTIKTIEVVGDAITLTVDQKRLSKTLIFFPSETFRQQILLENPVLLDITFKKKFPHTLVIIPIVRTPIAHLQTQTRSVFLDESGVVLSEADAGSQLPRIELVEAEVRMGKRSADVRILQSLQFIQGVRDLIPIENITEIDGGSLQAVTQELNIIFPQNKPISEILATLQTLLSGFRIKGTLPALVDLRFDKPIIRF